MKQKRKILIDVGSSTIKVYGYSNNKLTLLHQKSVHFKDGFDPQNGISEEKKKELFELLDAIKNQNRDALIKIYATGIFRKLTQEAKIKFIYEVFLRTGLFFNIISQDLENFYLEKALVGKCNLNEPILLINTGGGTTELVVMYRSEAVERKNLDIGVGTILSKYPQINESISKVSLEDIEKFVKENLPELENKVRIAFLTGGELTYMKLANYSLKPNNLFEDEDHPLLITIEDYKNKNKEIFEKITLEELERLMPENPKWMHGARAFSAIAQAICEKYGIEIIIPSDSNIINGVVRQEFRYVTIVGDFNKHFDYILQVKKELEERGVKVFVFSLKEKNLDSILKSDALIICNPAGYIETSFFLEISFALSLGKRIIFTEKPKEFILNNIPAEIGL
ncbi:MAG: hypothetical protein QXL82_02575 [Candidatus Aenigmatarchaeota archaeon]